jgi:hypothetical protein
VIISTPVASNNATKGESREKIKLKEKKEEEEWPKLLAKSRVMTTAAINLVTNPNSGSVEDAPNDILNELFVPEFF